MTTKLFTVEQCIEENIQLSAGYRDFEGYKGQTPDPQWPGQAKICVSIVLNYEEGGEYSVLNGDLRSETDLQEIMGRPIRPGARDIQMETQYEYGTRAGVWRIGRFFEERKVKVTVHAVGQSILKSPDAAKYLAGCGHEFSSHAYRWIDYHSMPLAVEEEQIHKCVDAIKEISGHPPKGWYVGRPSISSKGLVCHAFKQRGLELLYQSDSYGDDLPYWTAHPTEADKGLLMLPYTYDVNDNKFCTSPGFVNPTEWLEYCKSAFDVLLEEGRNGAPKMMSIGLHLRIIGRPARFAALKELIKYIQGHDEAWIATREEIARHWMKVHPFDASQLNRLPHFI